MHIMAGYLDLWWCVTWFAIATPFIILGAKKIINLIREHPDHKIIIALSGAFIFLLSSLKLPSVTGSSSHPTGTGFAAVLYGICVTSFLSLIVLTFQALLLAHGGLDTLGANVFSVGIAGPTLGIGVWILVKRFTNKIPICLFFATLTADLFAYVVTSIQMTLNYGRNIDALVEFMTNYSLTQVPISIIEGILFFMFAVFLMSNKPEIFDIAGSIGKKDRMTMKEVLHE